MSYQKQFQAIAKELTKFYYELAINKLRAESAANNIDARMVDITPDAGFPGANENVRKTAMLKAVAADEFCITVRKTIMDLELTVGNIESRIQGLEATRRALEWSLKANWMQHYGMITDEPTDIEPAEFDLVGDEIGAFTKNHENLSACTCNVVIDKRTACAEMPMDIVVDPFAPSAIKFPGIEECTHTGYDGTIIAPEKLHPMGEPADDIPF